MVAKTKIIGCILACAVLAAAAIGARPGQADNRGGKTASRRSQALRRQTSSGPIDPGVRGGRAGAGGFVPNLYPFMSFLEPSVLAQFEQVASVTGGPVGGNGLGPRFNSNSCYSCHSQPSPGGSSPPTNPLFSVYQLNGAQNTMPAFEAQNGPVLVPRFPYQPDLQTPDGHVHQLFTVTGRSDAGTCTISQPDFATAAAQNNLALRQPIPTFGDGYIEIVQNSDIIANMNANLPLKQSLGIAGHPNMNADTSISRFGWKAQWRALLPASAAEENVEMGISNELLPSENDQTPGCVLNPVPEDSTNFAFYAMSPTPQAFSQALDREAIFMRDLTVPKPGACSAAASSCANGLTQFNTIGCSLCHTNSLPEPNGSIWQIGKTSSFGPGIDNIFLYSDLLVHHMGPCLADNIRQGTAAGDEWRTPPLWNVGQRYFFLHDGRTSDIVQAVQDHFCAGNSTYQASEANAVVNAFNALSVSNQQDLINFLRSL
jgi:CxxC motif-containing protein (DUF1111 family)